MGKAKPTSQENPIAAGIRIDTSAYGNPIPLIYGRQRVAVNVIWVGPLRHIQYELKNEGGGGGTLQVLFGGFGGASVPGQSQVGYFISAAFGIGHGPIEGVRYIYRREQRRILLGGVLGQVNADEQNHYQTPGEVPGGRLVIQHWGYADSSSGALNLFLGTADQVAWTEAREITQDREEIIEGAPSPEVRYPTFAYFARHGWPLYTSPELPQINAEVFGLLLDPTVREVLLEGTAGTDPDLGPSPPTVHLDPNGLKVGANPADILQDLVENTIYGLRPPGTFLADLSQYRSYCKAAGLLLSPALIERRRAEEWLRDLGRQSNTDFLWSDGKLKALPLGDEIIVGTNAAIGPQETYTPDFVRVNPETGAPEILAQYEFTEDDFIPFSDGEAIHTKRRNAADAQNRVTVKYHNRHNYYSEDTRQARNLASITVFGINDAPDFAADFVTDGDTAQTLANIEIAKLSSTANLYEFQVDWRYSRLEPGDVVSLTHAGQTFSREPCRIREIEGIGERVQLIRAEQLKLGLTTAVLYPRPAPIPLPELDEQPGIINTPVMFEPVAQLSDGRLEIWIAAAGRRQAWGGCTVWMSEDDGVEFRPVARIERRAILGRVYATFGENDPSFDFLLGPFDPDIAMPAAYSDIEARRARSPMIVMTGGEELLNYEVLSYTASTKTGEAADGSDIYQIGPTLYRGQFGTDASATKRIGAAALLVDSSIARIPLRADLFQPKPSRLHFRFTSFNRYGGEEQSLDDPDVPDTVYQLRGILFRAPVAPIEKLQFFHRPEGVTLRWLPVTDVRGRVEYEIRRGADGFERASFVGRSLEERWLLDSDGTYWVAARVAVQAAGPDPLYVYGTPASITVEGVADLVKNVIVEHDELPLLWHDFETLALNSRPTIYWRLGSEPATPNVYDHVSEANVGSYVGTPTYRQPGFLPNDVDYSVALNGDGLNNDYVDLGSGAENDLDGDGWAFGVWFKTSYTGAVHQHLYSRDTTRLYVSATVGHLVLVTPFGTIDYAGDQRTGNWALALVTYSEESTTAGLVRRVRLYVGAVLVGTITCSSAYAVTSGTAYLGILSPGSSALQGNIGHFFKIARALGAHEVTSLVFAALFYERGIYYSFIERIAVMDLRFNEQIAGNVTNSATEANDGTIAGSVPAITGLLAGDDDEARSFNGNIANRIASPALPASSALVGLSAVMKPAALQNAYVVRMKDPSSGAATSHGASLRVASNGKILFDVVRTSGSVDTYEWSGPYVAGEEYHIVGLAWLLPPSSYLAALYVNGELAFLTPTPIGATINNPGTLRLYASTESVNGSVGAFNGVIDEVLYWSGSQNQLQATSGSISMNGVPVDLLGIAALTGHTIDGLFISDEGWLRAKPNSAGYFQPPDAHIPVLPTKQTVRIKLEYEAVAVGVESIRAEPDFNDLAQVDLVDLVDTISAEPEISVSDDAAGDTWSDWKPFEPGLYAGRRFRLRIRLASLASGIYATLKKFRWIIDVDDLVQSGKVTTNTGAATMVHFPRPFNLPPDGSPPDIAVSVRSTTANPSADGDRIVLGNESASGFSVSVMNGGVLVVRDVFWIAKGY